MDTDQLNRWHQASVDFSNLGTEKYYAWVKQMLTISFAGLTALVALQNHYRPDNDLSRYLLWATFVSLAVSVVCAAIVLRGEGTAFQYLADQLAALVSGKADTSVSSGGRNREIQASLSPAAKYAKKTLDWALPIAAVCLVAFGITNSM